MQARLRAELRSALQPPIRPTAAPGLPAFAALDALPFLHAVVAETLRLHAAVPGAQPRVSPGGAGGVLAGGVRAPAGTRVGAQAWSLHRHAAAFPRPDEWRPERWMEDEAAGLGLVGSEKKERWFWAFGSGGRMCVGSNFAMLGLSCPCPILLSLERVRELGVEEADSCTAMKLIVAAIWSSYETRVVDDTDIEQVDAFTATPKGKRLVLRFEPVDAEMA